ncbi:MAG: 3-dehydroquinate synthase [Myxococcales bacterium]|nr:3-dehydroquinate synthase [Myxococcales bacterium]
MVSPRAMMLQIESPPPSRYTLTMGAGLLEKLSSVLQLSGFSKVAILTEEHVAPHWLETVQRGLGEEVPYFVTRAGENHKTLASLEAIWSWMTEIGLDRRSVLLNLGGGLLGDLGGFAASCFMRGIAFVQLPTTLLSQVDASVGGKVGINFQGLKNLLGSFQQPHAVVMDVRSFSTLSRREFLSGFAEILKHGLIRERSYFEEVSSSPILSTLKGPADQLLGELSEEQERHLIGWIERSCMIKADVVQRDEREGGLRKLLNFGHTVGHAFETTSYVAGHPLLHGEAVGLGMIVEAEIARLAGFLEDDAVGQIEAALEHVGLPTKLPFFPEDGILWPAMRADKKNVGGAMHWTLLKSLGEGIFDQRVEDTVVEAALERVRGER